MRSLCIVLLVAVSAFLATALTAVAAEEASISLWAADPLTKISPEGKPITTAKLKAYSEKNSVWDASTTTVSLFSAKNEYVAFQLCLEGGDSGLYSVSLLPRELNSDSASIPAENFSLFGEYYTAVQTPSESPAYSMGPGLYPDALIPLTLPDYHEFKVAPARTQPVWVDLYVPSDTPAGCYRGSIVVAAAGCASREVAILLDVYDFALPAESHLRWRVGYNEALAVANGVPFSRRTSQVTDEYLDLELDFYRLCHRHRITPTTHYTTPIPDYTGSGADLEIDWASYDRRFARYLDGSAFDDGLPVNIFSLPVNPQSYGGFPSSTRPGSTRSGFGGVDSPLTRYKADLESYRKALDLTVAHWRDKGWNIDDAFVYVADEPHGGRYALIQDHCRVAKEVEPRLHRCIAFYRAFGVGGPKIVKEFADVVNHWSIAGDYMDTTALAEMKKRGDWVGIYQGSEPFQGGEALDMDALALTTWPWISWMYGLDTLFIYNSTEWHYSTAGDGFKMVGDIWDNPRNHGWKTNSQGVLFYPGLKVGLNRALPSIRLKAMRRGMQDYEYLWLLAEIGKKDLANSVSRRIIIKALQDASPGKFGDRYFGPGLWERDPAKWIAARKEMAEAIVAVKSPQHDADAPKETLD